MNKTEKQSVGTAAGCNGSQSNPSHAIIGPLLPKVKL